MKYPAWLPYPKAWGQAIVLLIQWLPVGLVSRLWFMGFATNFDLKIVSAISIGSVLMIYTLSLIHQILWHKQPSYFKWFPCWQCWLEGLWGFVTMIVSLVSGFAIALIIHDAFELNDEQADTAFAIASITLLAYCFHFRSLVSRKLLNKTRNNKQKINVAPQANIDPIEVELNRIKAEFGLKQMNDVKDNHKH